VKVRVTKIGKPSFKEATSWVNIYKKRLEGFCSPEFEILKDNTDIAKLIDQCKTNSALIVLLDERGKIYSSEQFATKIKEWTDNPQYKSIQFIIGGAYGFEDAHRKSAHYLWSISKLVLQGDLAWLLTSEQIYRAYNIIKGTGYHHS